MQLDMRAEQCTQRGDVVRVPLVEVYCCLCDNDRLAQNLKRARKINADRGVEMFSPKNEVSKSNRQTMRQFP